MKIRRSSTALSVLLAGLLCLLPAVGFARRGKHVRQHSRLSAATHTAAQPPSAPKLALLIGINDYFDNDRMSDLSGCENDVDDMSKLLTEHYHFKNNDSEPAKDDIIELKSQRATRDAILKNFDEHLIRKAKAHFESRRGMDLKDGATVVFYFSGHGSRTEDKNADELDAGNAKWDETIVPHDSGKAGVFDIVDDDMEVKVNELMKYTANITMIFDSCHSGTNTRGDEDAVEKDADPDKRQQPAQRPLRVNPAERPVGDVSSALLPRNRKYVAIAGSLPHEKSYELPGSVRQKNNGRANGTLTFYLTHALALNPNQTYREVINNVYDSVQRILPNQSPQVEGDIDRPFLAVAGMPVRPSVKVLALGEGGKTMTIKAGEAEGVRSGSLVVVYDGTQGTSTGDAGKLAHGEVKEAKMFNSTVELTPVAGAARAVKETDRVVLVAPNMGTKPLTVWLDTSARSALGAGASAAGAMPSDKGDETMRKVQSILQLNEQAGIKLLEAKLVKNPLSPQNLAGRGNGDLAVVRSTYREFKKGLEMPPSKGDESPDTEDGYYLTRGGAPLNYFWLPAGAPDATAATLARALESRARQENVRALRNAASPLNGLVTLEFVRLPGLRRVGDKAEGDPTPRICAEDKIGTPEVKLGEWFQFRIKNDSRQKVFVYLYNLGTSGSVSLLFPEPGEHKELKPGESVPTGRFDAGTPLGTDGFKLLVTTKQINALLLTSPGLTERGDETPLDRVLRSASAGTRDARGESYSLETWLTADFEYTVTVDKSSICPAPK